MLRNAVVDEAAETGVELHRLGLHFRRRHGHPIVGESVTVHKKRTCLPLSPRKLRADMVRRLDDEPKPVNPSGWVAEEGLLGPQMSQQRTLSNDTCSAGVTPVCNNFPSETRCVASDCGLFLLIYRSAEQGRRLSELIRLPIRPSSSSGKATIFLL